MGAYINFSIIRQRCKNLVQRGVHLLRRSFKEPSAAAVEKSVPCEDGFFIAILHEPADAVLGVAGRVEGFYGNAADVEGWVVGGRFSYAFAVFAADDGLAGEFGVGKLGGKVCVSEIVGETEVLVVVYQLLVSACVIPMAITIY